MIYTSNISRSLPPSPAAALVKPNEPVRSTRANPEGKSTLATAPVEPSVESRGIQAAAVTANNFTAALSSIADKAKAAEATQHARALILARPGAAMIAQANASSQSVQRLLQ